MRWRRQVRLILEKFLGYLTPAQHADESSTLPRSNQYDVICFSGFTDEFEVQPLKALLLQFAAHKHRVFYIHAQAASEQAITVTEIAPFLYGLHLRLNSQQDLAAPATVEAWLHTLENFGPRYSLVEAICLVQHPCWGALTQAIRNRLGWKIIYDDRQSSNYSGGSPQTAEHLINGSDLIISSAKETPNKWEEAKKTVILNPTTAPNDETAYRTLTAAIKNLYGLASIIIVSYNNLGYIRQCVESILAKTIYPNYEIIIVDNNSHPKVKTYLKEISRQHECIKVIFNPQNLGFAAANNIGLQQTTHSQFVVLLNNDVVVSRGWLIKLLRHLQDPEVGMVGPVTNWVANEAKVDINYHHPKDMEPFAEAYTQAHAGQFFDIQALAMYCLALRREVVDEVGLLDEQFGVGMFEDDDYSMRVRQTGRRAICTRNVFVHHYGMASFSKLKDEEYNRLFERNRQLYEAKWGQWTSHQNNLKREN